MRRVAELADPADDLRRVLLFVGYVDYESDYRARVQGTAPDSTDAVIADVQIRFRNVAAGI